jgi:ribose 5-phosphate isomerase RpiB
MGMSIIANKFPDVYAAVVETVQAAGNAAAINNANVLTMGGNVWKVWFCLWLQADCVTSGLTNVVVMAAVQYPSPQRMLRET